MSPKHTSWRTLERERVFSAGPIREIVRESVELPDGRVIPDFYTVSLADYALVYAITQRDEVLMLRQYKHGPRQVCLSFPGGHIREDETPDAAAARELFEETGYTAAQLHGLGSFVVDANQRCATAHLFRAESCVFHAQPRSGDLEEMELVRIPRAEVTRPERLAEMKLVSHVALALLAAGHRIE